ncbi:hypothetical protein [Glaciecola sp. 1036]|uniref:hypothetical protein n=1 Tax=Alteromonadaceae TaxID=72275 RepID=UPI003CFC650F
MEARIKSIPLSITATLLMLCFAETTDAKVTLRSDIEAKYVHQDIEVIDENRDIDSNNLVLTPRIYSQYEAKLLRAVISAEHNHVRRSLDDENVTNNYTTFNSLLRLNIVPDLMYAQAGWQQNYRNPFENSFIFEDFLVDAQNLAKLTTKSAEVGFDLPNRKLFGLSSQIGYRKLTTDYEQEISSSLNLDSETYDIGLDLTSGDDILPVTYRIQGSIRETKRSGSSDFESSMVNAELNIPTISNSLLFSILGTYENNDIGSANVSALQLQEYYSYGLGVTWRPSRDRSIRVALNKSFRDTEDLDIDGDFDDDDTFISANIRWRFTSRTSLEANVSKRFYGDSSNISFSHNTRHWRNRFSYQEVVTTNAQIIDNSELLLFNCPDGDTNIENCELLDTPNVPNNGLDDINLVPFVDSRFQLNNNAIILKTAQYTTGIQRRRTNVSLNLSRTKNEDLESDLNTTSDSAQLTASFRVVSRTTLELNARYTNYDRVQDGEDQSSIVKEFGVSFERRFRTRLFASIGYKYLDRQGDATNAGIGGNFIGLEGPLTDNRISLSIRYEFSNKQ